MTTNEMDKIISDMMDDLSETIQDYTPDEDDEQVHEELMELFYKLQCCRDSLKWIRRHVSKTSK